MNISKNEVLRYLGYKNQNMNEEMQKLIDNTIKEAREIAVSLFTYKLFNIEVFEQEIKLTDCNFILRGKDIARHLKDSEKCAIMAVTIGAAIDNNIRYLSKVNNTKALILDACGTEAVENTCNEAEGELRKLAERKGLQLTSRYSPGYGDFPLDIQPKLIRLLNADIRIGLTSTENFILLPRKSVTAIMGLTKVQNNRKKSCDECSAVESCLYRREGNSCGS